MIRKFVKPALPGATIPDPTRGRDLPQGGQLVVWGPHWARLQRRGDIVVSDPPADPAPEVEDVGAEAPAGTEPPEAAEA